MLAVLCASLVGIILTMHDAGPVGLRSFGLYVCTSTSSVGVLLMLMRVQVNYRELMSVLLLLNVCGQLLIDFSAAAWMRFRMWPLVVIVMDAALVFEIRQGVQYCIILCTVLALAVTASDSIFSFGLLDAVIEFEGGRDVDSAPVWQCDCPAPPCSGQPMGSGLLTWSMSTFIFVADYYLTRKFSVQLRGQLAVVAATVRVSERMTSLLAAYSTDDARRVVALHGADLPEALRVAYEQLLDNLDGYRVFLPDSLLYDQQQQQQQEIDEELDADPHAQERALQTARLRSVCSVLRVQPPARTAPGHGEEEAHLGMCFTDIQSSTALWEAYPQGMYSALNQHNDLMRSCCAACNGYEVKTIGDSFMVAFDRGLDALRFGLEAQLGLLRQKWPDDLLLHPLCQAAAGDDGEPLWNGLRVRIGVHSGEARVQRNPVTGRSDYFGPTVNTASRLEAALRRGGLVATSDTVVKELGAQELRTLGTPVVHEAGHRELRGVREMVSVWVILPRALAGRLAVLSEPDGNLQSPASSSGPEVGFPQGSSARRSACSVGSWHSAEGSDDKPPRRARDLAVRVLRRSGATCAAARLPLSATPSVAGLYQSFAAATALAVDQSRGVVDGIMSACVAVSWNAARPCADHASACRRFLGANFRCAVHLGAGSGGVLSGSIAAGRRSFTTVVGGCVDLAAALAEEAERCGDTALVTGAVADDCSAAGTAHWAQLWEARGEAQVLVMAVLPSDDDVVWLLGRENTDAERALEKRMHAELVAALFRKACAGEPGSEVQEAARDELVRMCSTGSLCRDAADAARLLAGRLAKGGVRTRPMPPLWDGEEHRAWQALGAAERSSPTLLTM